ncbi:MULTISPECIES: PucR family transcriptional regulator [Rhodococcus]|uniref:Putative CdaR family transcriptional regulator n=1 Tax=Rhodococcus wratislaviensis NBRC 100605 TaxID=1219028 RepID=X0QCZ6_RHOWR|nr:MULTISPECIES: helix-turn-helix domain-containing protein [Rhodococcus]WAM18076.1 helix-turn-helix domain-containing protein [Rhodococcus sp. JS3073]GAF48786.1 putative CdaR family transcriptional regulator [Rhodococcus wratislaviensis NBRC 100605]
MRAASETDLRRSIARMRRSIPRLARTTIDRYIQATPLYEGTGVPDHLHRESAHTVRSMLDVCLRSVVEDSIDIAETMRESIERGTERVSEGLPLREYMRCWQTAFDVLAEALESEWGRDHETFWFVLGRARRTNDRILRDVASAYEIHARELVAAQDHNHAPIIDAVLRGDDWIFDDPELVPAQPVVLFLDIGDVPGEKSGDAHARSVAVKRKVRRLRAQLARELPGLWLTDIRPNSGRLLMHPPSIDLDSLVADLEKASGARVTAGIDEAAGVGDLPRAGRTAREVLEVGLRCGLTGRAIRIDDVALEHHFAHASASLGVLMDRCSGLRNRPELVQTLRVYLACNQDRRGTADTLFVHPNTVDNRLNRVRELTGLDVHVTNDLLTLAVAVNSGIAPPEA